MTQPTSSNSDYTLESFSEGILETSKRYTAQSHARHLLPHLRPGQRVLDFGCGPGTISVGLAKAVEPGELSGVDIKESQVEIARTVARFQGQRNAVFHVGDVLDLPFEDGFFDVAHGHDILMRVADAAAALAEVKRVLKPGGIIACREMICRSHFMQPDLGVMRRSWDIFEDVLVVDGGHPQMGKELKARLDEAGFANAQITASVDIYSTPSEIEFVRTVDQEWHLSQEITDKAIKYGASTRELLDRIEAAYERWKHHPGAVYGVAFGEAIAGKPSP